MNERLTIQDLTDLLAAKHSMTKKDAEAFVKEFFLLIEQALEIDKYVKIKGLGTFKLIDVDSRESVNVNTGERFQIKGHTKVSFTPDPNLRDTINKPFSHFETVVLNENTVLEDTAEEETEEDENGEGTATQVSNNKKNGLYQNEDKIAEIQEISEINEQPVLIQEAQVAEEVIIENNTGNDSEAEETVIEDKVVREEIVEESQEESPALETTEVERTIIQPEETISKQQSESKDVKQEVLSAETIIAQELAKANLEPVTSKEQLETVQQKPVTKVVAQKEKSPVPYLIAVIIIVLLLCGGAVLYIYYPDIFTSSPNKEAIDMPVTTQPVQPETQLLDSIGKKDTTVVATPNVSTGTEEVAVPPVVKKEPETSAKTENKATQEQASAPVYSDSASYTITGTKTTHTIKEGETLTKVSLRYYGTKGMWPYIVKHNPNVIKNPNTVPYGTKIKIPELTKK
ncbi:HU family DNA-binding protein [Bacteroides faecalis]|uniref:Integration host factor n=1 Tax=Bacteroides faecalis TaxID=2447885 RepID=A0A401LXY8_9BACE|nr:HU family DNA-binding protein [Bacteroides faecalis]GCB36373.1 integration host factor [Bacteroides faecalis]